MTQPLAFIHLSATYLTETFRTGLIVIIRVGDMMPGGIVIIDFDLSVGNLILLSAL